MSSKSRTYATRPDWTRQQLIGYGGPLAIGVVILQAFLASPSLDLPAFISVICVAASIPLLSAAVLITHAQTSYQYASWPAYLTFVIVAGQSAAFLGVLAAMWHLSWIAALVLLVSATMGVIAYRAYVRRLEGENRAATPHDA